VKGKCSLAGPDPEPKVPAWLADRYPGARITPIVDGWSDDRKYRIDLAGGSRLLRVSPLEFYSRKQEELRQVGRANEVTGVLPQALEHGAVPEYDVCFVAYEWVVGEMARPALSQLPADAQYRHGLNAGRVLRAIHELPQEQRVDTHAIITGKAAQRSRVMREEALAFPGYETLVDFLDANLDRLKGAPTSFRHGDFHPGNMLIAPDGALRVIDLNRSDFGDPMEDFNRLFTFSRQVSIPFARGQLHGYFDGPPPAEFWPHALCFVVMDCAFGLLWARRFGEREIAVHRGLVEQVMTDFDQLRVSSPLWWSC